VVPSVIEGLIHLLYRFFRLIFLPKTEGCRPHIRGPCQSGWPPWGLGRVGSEVERSAGWAPPWRHLRAGSSPLPRAGRWPLPHHRPWGLLVPPDAGYGQCSPMSGPAVSSRRRRGGRSSTARRTSVPSPGSAPAGRPLRLRAHARSQGSVSSSVVTSAPLHRPSQGSVPTELGGRLAPRAVRRRAWPSASAGLPQWRVSPACPPCRDREERGDGLVSHGGE
jgi:hypothetical protein